MSDSSQASFARDLGLLDATMIDVGAMIGAGIFVLIGIAARVSGPASILAFALNGAVTLITAFAYAELGEDGGFRRCLFPTAGGPHARFAAELLGVLSGAFEMEITAGYVVPPGASAGDRSEVERWIEKTLTHLGVTLPAEQTDRGGVGGQRVGSGQSRLRPGRQRSRQRTALPQDAVG